uniref:Mitogen-activated protein kinase kinase kinase 4 n=3 Tax=Lygus hesperus TaxID=30085 RepID=A0A0A9W7V4_LYGHE
MYLIEARSKIPQLLDDILNYKFMNKSSDDSSMTYSNQSSDSGINLTCTSDQPCSGCYWFFCPFCLESANKAIDQIKSLTDKLDEVEELFPSTKAFGNQFAVYKSNEFVGKLNAMFIWYNIMRHLRLKILILGKQLVAYAQEKADRSDTDSSSPGDSQEWDFSNLSTKPAQPLHSLRRYFYHSESGDTRTYRKYIEDVLKSKGLRKAMFFLESLYLKSLKRGRIALLNPNKSNLAEAIDSSEEQLMRFGFWSEEYMSMDLPSIRPAFLFISRIPLDVLHEFLVMRLENKLDKPSALSIRQLIKELKEAIKLSVINKQRYVHQCEVALEGESEDTKQKMYLNYVSSFDQTVYSVLKLYLNYIVQWVTLAEHEKLQKDILEEEWKFVTTKAPHIPEGESLAGIVFCTIAKTMLCNIATCMRKNMELMQADETPYEEPLNFDRQRLLTSCRSLQTTCAETRDKTFRVLSLTKTLIKYLESESLLTCDKLRGPLDTLKEGILETWKVLKERVTIIEKALSPLLRECENSIPVVSLCREVLHRMYKFALEYVKDIVKLLPDKRLLARDIVEFSKQWIRFVTNYCERGRGVRPRWANYGLDFLLFVTDPSFTCHLHEREFESFKRNISSCVAHIMGTPSTTLPTHLLPCSPYPGHLRLLQPSPEVHPFPLQTQPSGA